MLPHSPSPDESSTLPRYSPEAWVVGGTRDQANHARQALDVLDAHDPLDVAETRQRSALSSDASDALVTQERPPVVVRGRRIVVKRQDRGDEEEIAPEDILLEAYVEPPARSRSAILAAGRSPSSANVPAAAAPAQHSEATRHRVSPTATIRPPAHSSGVPPQAPLLAASGPSSVRVPARSEVSASERTPSIDQLLRSSLPETPAPPPPPLVGDAIAPIPPRPSPTGESVLPVAPPGLSFDAVPPTQRSSGSFGDIDRFEPAAPLFPRTLPGLTPTPIPPPMTHASSSGIVDLSNVAVGGDTLQSNSRSPARAPIAPHAAYAPPAPAPRIVHETPSIAPVAVSKPTPDVLQLGTAAPAAPRRSGIGKIVFGLVACAVVSGLVSAAICAPPSARARARSYGASLVARLHQAPTSPTSPPPVSLPVAVAVPAPLPAEPSSASPVSSAASVAPPAATPAPIVAAAAPEAVSVGSLPPASVSVDALPKVDIEPTKTLVTFPVGAEGHRVYVDSRELPTGAAPAKLKCGKHNIRIGSGGKVRKVDLPCGQKFDLL